MTNAVCSSEQNQASKVVPGVTKVKLCLKCVLCADNCFNGMSPGALDPKEGIQSCC